MHGVDEWGLRRINDSETRDPGGAAVPGVRRWWIVPDKAAGPAGRPVTVSRVAGPRQKIEEHRIRIALGGEGEHGGLKPRSAQVSPAASPQPLRPPGHAPRRPTR